MTVATKHSIAFRLGRALGGVARFCMHDRSIVLRWIKRALVGTILLAVLVSSFSWLASAAIWVGIIALAAYGYRSPGQAWTDEEWESFQAPYGRDVLGRPLTVRGDVENPYDLTS